jgi:selenium metabolism protein YedF
MHQVHIECQGLPCPQPVLKAKKIIEKESPTTISVVVDNEAAKINVSRFLGTQQYETTVENKGDAIVVTGIREEVTSEGCKACEIMSDSELNSVEQQKVLIFLASNVMGEGDDELGSKLMYNFLLTLKELGDELWRIVMVNGGVKLATQNSACLELLQQLEKDDVSVLVCGTCLEHFNLTQECGVGEVTNMLDIVTSFQLATKTIRV